jgi:hypothetical protein
MGYATAPSKTADRSFCGLPEFVGGHFGRKSFRYVSDKPGFCGRKVKSSHEQPTIKPQARAKGRERATDTPGTEVRTMGYTSLAGYRRYLCRNILLCLPGLFQKLKQIVGGLGRRTLHAVEIWIGGCRQ